MSVATLVAKTEVRLGEVAVSKFNPSERGKVSFFRLAELRGKENWPPSPCTRLEKW